MGRPRTAVGDPDRLERRRAWDRDRYSFDDPAVVWCRLQVFRLRRRAKRAGVAFDVTIDDLLALLNETNMIDPVLGAPMQFGRGQGAGAHPDVSVCERLDQAGPFNRVNLIVISHRARQMLAAPLVKYAMTEDLAIGDHSGHTPHHHHHHHRHDYHHHMDRQSALEGCLTLLRGPFSVLSVAPRRARPRWVICWPRCTTPITFAA